MVHRLARKDLIVEGIVLKSQLKENEEKFDKWKRVVMMTGGEDKEDIFNKVEEIV